jgi:hypothetical protein
MNNCPPVLELNDNNKEMVIIIKKLAIISFDNLSDFNRFDGYLKLWTNRNEGIFIPTYGLVSEAVDNNPYLHHKKMYLIKLIRR